MFSEITENSFYYKDAQLKTEETRRRIVEEELKGEQTARRSAELRADNESIKRTLEEVARKEAEQREKLERLAKEEQERETEAQKQRAERQEKENVLELARTNPLIKAIISGELKIYFDLLPWYAAPGVSGFVTAVASDFTKLNLGFPVNIRRVYNANDADIAVFWVRDYGGHTIGEAIFQSHIKVGLGTNNCLGEWMAFDSITVGRILWHELGHSMGYGHSDDLNNIMYHQMPTRFEIDQKISEVISSGWYYVTSFCGAGTYSYSFQADSVYSGFDLYVIPPGQDSYEISGGKGLYYPSCSAENMTRYSNTCTVPEGARIYIGNTSFRDAIRLSGEIINKNSTPTPNFNWDPKAFRYNMNDLTKYWNLFHGKQ